MKRTIASIGLAAVGVSALQAQNAPESKTGDDKSWTISSSLRGFYDDNFNNQDSANAKKSWGVEFTPSASYTLTTIPNTSLTASAGYNSRTYTEKDVTDQSVQLSTAASHRFSDKISLQVEDRFVVAQEPEVLESEAAAKSTVLRAQGNNIHNMGKVGGILVDAVKNVDIQASYQNDVYAYDNPTYQPLLDRMEHDADASLRYHTGHGFFSKTGIGLLDYQFTDTEYSDNILDQGGVYKDASGNLVPLNPQNLESSIRNNRAHAVLLGYTENLNKSLNFTVRGGAQFFDFYNTDKTKTSPIATADLTWNYAKKSKATVGVREQHNATDILVGDGITGVLSPNNLVLDAETTSAYVKVDQALTWVSDRLTATVYGFYQHSKFDGGVFLSGDDTEDYYVADGKLSFEVVRKIVFFDTGYTYTQLGSTSRPFERNRGYVGLTAKF